MTSKPNKKKTNPFLSPYFSKICYTNPFLQKIRGIEIECDPTPGTSGQPPGKLLAKYLRGPSGPINFISTDKKIEEIRSRSNTPEATGPSFHIISDYIKEPEKDKENEEKEESDWVLLDFS